MKILQLNAVYGFGSTGIVVYDIEQLLRQHGNEVLTVYQAAYNPPEKGMRVGNIIDWKWHALYTRLSGRQAYGSRHATGKLIAYIQKELPDVVHLHNLHSNYVNLPMLLEYLASAGIHTVVTLHDCWFFTGKCTHFAAVGCQRWQSGCGKCPLWKSSPAGWFSDCSDKVLQDRIKLFQNIGKLTVVGCSDWIASLAEISPVFKGKSVVRIYNGVDTSVFNPMDRGVLRMERGLEDKFVILVMANKFFNPANADAARQLIDGLDANERLLVAGCNDEQRRKLGGNPKVSGIGFIKERSKLAEVYNIADVFVNLTLEDTLPTVNMEAICCGTPVVTYDSCGSPELVSDGITGYVIPPFDYEKLQIAISLVKKSNLLRSQCADLGKKNFDRGLNYKKYINLYKKIQEN